MNLKWMLLPTLVISMGAIAQSGEDVYNKACTTCHSIGVAGAPLVHDQDLWKPRLDKGIDTLVGSIKQGLNAMPPGGMCTDCTDEDYKNAIKFMSEPKP